MGIGAREGGKEGGRRARGREQRAARGTAGASAARPSRLLRLLSVRSARARGGMGWPGGSPCCCPAPPRPRPAGRPPQVSGREAPGGRAAACASRRGGQCQWWSPGGAGPLRGANGRGERSGRVRSGVGGRGPRPTEAGKVTRGRGQPTATPRPAVSPSRVGRALAAARSCDARAPPPQARDLGGNWPGRVRVRVFLFHLTSGETEARAASIVSFPDHPGHSRAPLLPSLSPSLGLTPPPRLGSQPLIQPQLFPGRGSVGGGVSPNKPRASE